MSDSKTVMDGKILLYSYVDGKERKRVNKWAELPKETARDWEGFSLRVLDWKITNGIVRVTYMTSQSDYAPIFNADMPVVTVELPLQPPSRSRNWEWNEWSNCWRNKRTGERITEY